MKEIGGYIEFEKYQGHMLHKDGILLNCGRSCIAYLIKAKNIRKMVLPYFMCDSVFEVCEKNGVHLRFYHVDEKLRPEKVEIESDEWFYLMSFYGQLTTEEIEGIGKKYRRVIVDFTHDYFHEPVAGLDTIYTCRKFFGVSDGAVLYTDNKLEETFDTDESYDRIGYLVGRYERTAGEFFRAACDNNAFYDNEPIKYMSRLTENLLRGIDYQYTKDQRTKNYACLHEHLKSRNLLSIRKVEGPYAYPFLIKNGASVRRKLAERNIFVATLWPNVLELPKEYLEHKLAENILPLPCDHRYNEDDMMIIIEEIEKQLLSEANFNGIKE